MAAGISCSGIFPVAELIVPESAHKCCLRGNQCSIFWKKGKKEEKWNFIILQQHKTTQQVKNKNTTHPLNSPLPFHFELEHDTKRKIYSNQYQVEYIN